MAENLFRALLKGREFGNVEELNWVELSAADKRCCIENARYDIDFAFFYSPADRLFQDSALCSLLSNNNGTIVHQPYVQRLQGGPFASSLVLFDVKPWKIGICLTENEEDDETFFIDDVL
jgi:hypothetical protein